MFLKKYILKKTLVILFGIILFSISNSCGIWDPADARKISPNADERAKKNLEEGKGITLGGMLGGGSGRWNKLSIRKF